LDFTEFFVNFLVQDHLVLELSVSGFGGLKRTNDICIFLFLTVLGLFLGKVGLSQCVKLISL
jgi:hypothetical protein